METRYGGERRTKIVVKNSKVKYLLVILLVVALVMGSLAIVHATETPLHDETPGTIITFSGRQWIILEQMPNGETYILLNDQIGTRAFDPDNTNLFNPSDTNNIAYYLNNDFYNSLSQKELIADHSWDRISVDGSRVDSTDFGNVTCKIGLLSYREYERYSKYYNSNGILPGSYSYWWWTRTPRTGSSRNVWVVDTSGGLYTDNASNTGGSVRPALYLKSGILIDQNKVVVGEGSINRPSSPSGVSANAESSTSVNISWQGNTEADLAGYKIYRNNTEIANVDKTVTRYNDITVAPGITYTYEITAYNTSNLESARSSPITVTTPPATPTGVTGQATGRNITLTWQGPGNPQYIIERSNDGISFTQVAEVSQTSFTETAPLWGTTYYYRVAQKAQDGTVSGFTEPIQVTTDPVPVPTGLSASVTARTVTLTWNAVSGITRYIVERSLHNEEWQTLDTTTSTTYTDQDTVFATRYYYRVLSDGGNGQLSEPSQVVQVTTDNVTAPSNLTATQSGDAVELSWSPAQDVNIYIIERSNDGNTWATLAEVQNTNQYIDTNVQKNTEYYYRVRSNGITQVSDPSNVTHVRVIGIPDPVTGLTANVSGKKITLTWTPQPYVQYVVARSADGQQWQQVAELNVPTFEDTNTHYDTTYYYRVSAKNEAGTSEPAEVSATTAPVPVPTNVTAAARDNEIQIQWSGVTGITGYRVERSLNGTAWEQATVTEQTSWKDTGLQWATTYYYRVRAVDGDKESQPSAAVTATTAEPPVPVAPRLSTAVDNTEISVSWNYQSVVNGYKVYVNGEFIAELSGQATSFVYEGERGKTYTITLEAFNEFGTAQASRTVTVGRLETPGATNMATDILGNSLAVAGSMGSLVALGLALKGNGIVATILKLLLR